MKSVLDAGTRQEILNRIDHLSPDSKALWGKMNALQMLRHCTLSDDMYLGTLKTKQAFIGRLIGKMILKKVLKDESPFGKNSPTSPLLNTTQQSSDTGWEQQKAEWKKRVEMYANYNNPGFVHPFFGPVTKEQAGFLVYKHYDHHLRQFGV